MAPTKVPTEDREEASKQIALVYIKLVASERRHAGLTHTHTHTEPHISTTGKHFPELPTLIPPVPIAMSIKPRTTPHQCGGSPVTPGIEVNATCERRHAFRHAELKHDIQRKDTHRAVSNCVHNAQI